MLNPADFIPLQKNKKKKNKDMTKNTDFILEKAFSEFLNSSYAEVSTNDLERATGLTRGAIYYTYKSKEELFRAVIERFVLDKQHVPLSPCGGS